MELRYNGVALHELGEVTISQGREYEDGQRCRVTLKVGLMLFERSYADNYARVLALRDALRTQNAVLQWTNTDTGQDYLNQTVTVLSGELPEEWGTYQMPFNLVFSYYEQNLNADNIVLTYSPLAGPAGVALGNVAKFAESVTQERPTPHQAARSLVRGRVQISGWLFVETAMTQEERRHLLEEKRVALRAALLTPEGVLRYATAGTEVFNKTVRVEEPTVEIDQERYTVAWSFTATYTEYEDAATWAVADYSAEERDNNTGEIFLAFSGRVTSRTEAAARTKLTAVTAVVLAAYGYAAGQQLRNDTGVRAVATTDDGDAFVELSFNCEYRRWRADNLTATFKRTGTGGPAVSFGEVHGWELQYFARRFVDLRSQRQNAGGTISASGVWKANLSDSLVARRAAMLAIQGAMINEVNGADGTLTYGGFSQVVRIENLRAVINQAITGIEWSFEARYSLFPNESGYAVVDMTVNSTNNIEDLEDTLTVAGTILAPDEASARAKLTALRTGVLSQYGYGLVQGLRTQATARTVFANGDKTAGLSVEASDGTTFVELTFSEEYRKRHADLITWHLQVSSRKDIPTGLITTVYSGTVVSGGTADGAYAAALAKAEELGDAKESTLGGSALLRGSQITWDTRQIQLANVKEFVRLNFSYEYVSKIPVGNAFLEVTTDLTVDTFGVDTTNVSGYVVAVDFSTAESLYKANVRDAYNTGLVRGERFAKSKVMGQRDGGGFTTQEIRCEFSFQVVNPKQTGSVTYRYGMSVSNDYLTLTRTTSIRGSAFALSEAEASAGVAALVSTLMGSSPPPVLRESNSSEYEKATVGPVLTRYDFEKDYAQRITGEAGLLEMQVTEQVRYSGVRWIQQPIPRNAGGNGGVTIVQDGGIEPGSRTVRGNVTSGSVESAKQWGRAQRVLLTGDTEGHHYVQPEEWETNYEFVPRVDGVVNGGGANVRLYRVTFGFSEILPNYPVV